MNPIFSSSYTFASQPSIMRGRANILCINILATPLGTYAKVAVPPEVRVFLMKAKRRCCATVRALWRTYSHNPAFLTQVFSTPPFLQYQFECNVNIGSSTILYAPRQVCLFKKWLAFQLHNAISPSNVISTRLGQTWVLWTFTVPTSLPNVLARIWV